MMKQLFFILFLFSSAAVFAQQSVVVYVPVDPTIVATRKAFDSVNAVKVNAADTNYTHNKILEQAATISSLNTAIAGKLSIADSNLYKTNIKAGTNTSVTRSGNDVYISSLASGGVATDTTSLNNRIVALNNSLATTTATAAAKLGPADTLNISNRIVTLNTNVTTLNTAVSTKEPAILGTVSPGQYINSYKKIVALNADSIAAGSTNLFYTPSLAAAKANAISPTFSGTPTVPTPLASDSSLQAINSAFLKQNISTTVTPIANSVATLNTALASKANATSPAFSGTPTVPTPATADSSLQAVNSAFVKQTVNNSLTSQNVKIAALQAGNIVTVDPLLEVVYQVRDSTKDSVMRFKAIPAHALPIGSASDGVTGFPTARVLQTSDLPTLLPYSLLGNSTASTGHTQNINFGTGFGFTGNTVNVVGGGGNITGTAASDSATIGAENFTAGGFTMGTGWGGTFAAGFTHTAGQTATLTSTAVIKIDSAYRLSYTFTGGTVADVLITGAGGLYSNVSTTGFIDFVATGAGAIIFTPGTTHNKTLTVSLKAINPSVATATQKSSDGVVRSELRISNLSNNYRGIGTGKFSTTANYNDVEGGGGTGGFLTSAMYCLVRGFGSMTSNDQGSYDAVFGNFSAIKMNAPNNSVFGNYSFQNSTFGTNNIVSGFNAANVAVDGSLLTGVSNSSFIGAGTKASKNNTTDENVWGNGAESRAPNSHTIGNYSNTKIFMNGATVLWNLTKAQRNALIAPEKGSAIFQTDLTPGLRVYNGTNWVRYTETID